MRVLHLPESFLPYHTGGKETYTLNLIKSLTKLGIEGKVLIHQRKDHSVPSSSYRYENIHVDVLPRIPDYGSRKSVYDRSYTAIPGFSDYLKAEKPDLVHFHDFSGGASLTHLKEVKKQGIKAIMTYHSPGQSCMQRSLRYADKIICSGKLDQKVCTKCLFLSNGIDPFLSRIFSSMPTGLIINDTDSKFRRAITASSATKLFIDSFYEGIALFDKIHVHAAWVHDLFILNKIQESSLFQARIAGPASIKRLDRIFPVVFNKERPLRLVFSGRCESIKGIHVLIEAGLLLPSDAAVEFHFLGPTWETSYGRSLSEKIKNDQRFKPPIQIDPSRMLESLEQMDIMVVPSTWPETGPLTMLEAFAVGMPVIGSNIGGIPEWIWDGKNGLLFDIGCAEDLFRKISLVLNNPDLLGKLSANVEVTRNMDNLALEMSQLYKNITS